MRKYIIGFIVGFICALWSSNAFAITVERITNESRPAKVTILRGCDIARYGRYRGVRNYNNKCKNKQKKRLRSTRSRRSVILQSTAPRFRSSVKVSNSTPLKSGYVRLLPRNVVTQRVRRPVYDYQRWTQYFLDKRKREQLLKTK